MGDDKVSRDDVESIIPEEWGGMWFLNDGLDMESLGFALLALEPGWEEPRP